MDNYFQIISSQLNEIDVSKIPLTVKDPFLKKMHKTENVCLYIHGFRIFIVIDLKDLINRKYNSLTINELLVQPGKSGDKGFINYYNNYYHFYNLDKYKKDYPNSAIELFANQKSKR